MRQTHFIALLIGLLAAYSLIGASALPLQEAPDTPQVPEGIPYPPVPDDLLAAFIASVQQSTEYTTARALSAPAVEAIIASYAPEFLGSVDLAITEHDFVGRVDGESWPLELSPGVEMEAGVDSHRATYRGERIYYYTLSIVQGEEVEEYWLPDESLEPFNFQYATVLITNRISRTLERFSVSNMELTAVVRELCTMAGIDYIVSAGADQLITCSISNKTIQQVLQYVAASAGQQMEFRLVERPSIHFSTIHRVLTDPDSRDGFDFGPIVTPEEALRALIRFTVDSISTPIAVFMPVQRSGN